MRVGYLAPRTSFDGIVHSVFARACNISHPLGLLTLAARGLADGPTVWRLGGSATPDLRSLFAPGDRLRCRQAAAFTRDVELDLTDAATWLPPSPPRPSSGHLPENLRRASAALDRRRGRVSSVVDCEAQASLRLLEDACSRLDVERATAAAHRLVGRGEGLTPAGDDALVGILASLGALAHTDAQRAAFLRALSLAVGSRVARTTVISAHYLRLAAQGHFNADVALLIHAFVVGDAGDGTALREALDAVLDVGATSGADMVGGMIAGLRAWAPPP
jgi:hypothetical protein